MAGSAPPVAGARVVTTPAITAVEAWRDSTGTIHPTKEAALFVEITRALGRVGNGDSLAPGLAKVIVEQRAVLVPLLEAFGPVENGA